MAPPRGTRLITAFDAAQASAEKEGVPASIYSIAQALEKAECVVGIGFNTDDVSLPAMLAHLADLMGKCPVDDVVYIRSKKGEVHTSQETVVTHGEIKVMEGKYPITDFPLVSCRLKLLSLLDAGILKAGDDDQRHHVKGKKVTLIGDFEHFDRILCKALEALFLHRGAKSVEFVRFPDKLSLSRPHRHQQPHLAEA